MPNKQLFSFRKPVSKKGIMGITFFLRMLNKIQNKNISIASVKKESISLEYFCQCMMEQIISHVPDLDKIC